MAQNGAKNSAADHITKPPISALPLIGLIRIYQKVLSPFVGNQCRFYPTCSHYAVEALTQHGAIKGSYLAVKRIVRCNPYFEGGDDPVPPKKSP